MLETLEVLVMLETREMREMLDMLDMLETTGPVTPARRPPDAHQDFRKKAQKH